MDSTNYYIVFYKYAKILTHETACEIKVSYTHLQLFFKHDIHLLHHSETSMNKGISGEGLPFT